MATTTNVVTTPKVKQRRAAERDVTPKVMKQGELTPWLYLLPALILMTIYIVYPMLNTIRLSLTDREGNEPASAMCIEGQPCWGVFENYRYALTNEFDFRSPGRFWSSFWSSSYGNNVKWILVMVTGTVGLGLLVALLADRVKYESLAKSVIFMPMAISFVGAGVIWGFVYDYDRTGLLNAIITGLGGSPVSFITTPGLNTFALIMVGIWIWTGFCMTILSAALKSVPTEILEAARVDGANEWKVFWDITVPIIMPTIVVAVTVMIINVLKIFDIVYVMTGGKYGTEVIANRMYTEMYINYQTGRGTAIAVILVVVLIPFMIVNIRRAREQEAMR